MNDFLISASDVSDYCRDHNYDLRPFLNTNGGDPNFWRGNRYTRLLVLNTDMSSDIVSLLILLSRDQEHSWPDISRADSRGIAAFARHVRLIDPDCRVIYTTNDGRTKEV